MMKILSALLRFISNALITALSTIMFFSSILKSFVILLMCLGLFVVFIDFSSINVSDKAQLNRFFSNWGRFYLNGLIIVLIPSIVAIFMRYVIGLREFSTGIKN